MEKDKIRKLIYWLILAFVILLQFIFIINSTNQIRYEELAESVRNVFWLQNKTIYDGVSSNIGWYGTLMVIYNLFGFSLNTAKIFRFILQIISLFCLAIILRKYLKEKAWLPLLTIGLSPILIYFTTLQTSYGMDLQYLPVCFLLAIFDFKNKILKFLKPVVFGLVTMIAWMSYPTFLFYLPSLWGIYIWKLIKNNNIESAIKKFGVSLFSFFIPLLMGFLYIKDIRLLIFDSHEKSGIFRGAGTIKIDLNIFWQNITHFIFDLFQKGASYYFELPQSDFSGYYPLITIIFVLISSIVIFIKLKKYRLILLFAISILLFNLLLANFNLDPSRYPGVRRNTGILAAFYIMVIISWKYFSNKKLKSSFLRDIILVIFLLLPIHHLLSYPSNLDSLKNPSYFREIWFGSTNSPENYLNSVLLLLQKNDLPLSCRDKDGKIIFCRYSEIYGALAGTCYWNKLNCKKILGYDPKTKKFIPLSIDLWKKYYWEH